MASGPGGSSSCFGTRTKWATEPGNSNTLSIAWIRSLRSAMPNWFTRNTA